MSRRGDCGNGTNPGAPLLQWFRLDSACSYTSFNYHAVVDAPASSGSSSSSGSSNGVGNVGGGGNGSDGSISLNPVRRVIASARAAGRTFLEREAIAAEDASPLTLFTVHVTNTGGGASDEAVLAFIVPPDAGTHGIPLQTLFAFDRVHVPAGETVQVSFAPSVKDLAYVDTDGTHHVLAGAYRFEFGIRPRHAGFELDGIERTGFTQVELHFK